MACYCLDFSIISGLKCNVQQLWSKRTGRKAFVVSAAREPLAVGCMDVPIDCFSARPVVIRRHRDAVQQVIVDPVVSSSVRPKQGSRHSYSSVPSPTTWLVQHKLMQAMASREQIYVLEGNIQINDAYRGDEHSDSKAGRGRSPPRALNSLLWGLQSQRY